MRPTVHLRPARLREHADTAAELSEVLQEASARRPRPGADLDPLNTMLRRAVRELAELGAVLRAAADSAEAADSAAARGLREAGRA